MRFEWDAEKATRNARSHGVSFDEARELFSTYAPVLEVYDADHQRLVGYESRGATRVPGEHLMSDREELTREELSRALTRAQRKRIIAGKLEPGDVAALRRFVCLTQEQFAEALGISVHTLRNWEQDRVKPDGPGLALLRIAARHPRIVRENVNSAA